MKVNWKGGEGSFVAKWRGGSATLVRGPGGLWEYDIKFERGPRRWETSGSFSAAAATSAKAKADQEIADLLALVGSG